MMRVVGGPRVSSEVIHTYSECVRVASVSWSVARPANPSHPLIIFTPVVTPIGDVAVGKNAD